MEKLFARLGNLPWPKIRVECRRSVQNPVQLDTPSDADLAKYRTRGSYSVRKWWNWQTHHLEGVAPKGVGVQIPPSAPIFPSLTPSCSPVTIQFKSATTSAFPAQFADSTARLQIPIFIEMQEAKQALGRIVDQVR